MHNIAPGGKPDPMIPKYIPPIDRYEETPNLTLDIIITGTGRSGTSFVAKVLEEDFGFCMGHHIDRGPGYERKDHMHRWGIWEYKRTKNWFKAYEVWKNGTPENVTLALKHTHPPACHAPFKATKVPWMCQATPEIWKTVLKELNTKLIIWAWRPAEQVIDSRVWKWGLSRRRKMSQDEWLKFSTVFVHTGLWRLQNAFSQIDVPVLKINFSNEVPRYALMGLLAPYVNEIKNVRDG
jgi:hypothetical protein